MNVRGVSLNYKITGNQALDGIVTQRPSQHGACCQWRRENVPDRGAIVYQYKVAAAF